MHSISAAVQRAADALQRISDGTAGERSRRAGTVALVLRVVEAIVDGGPDACGLEIGFIRRRAETEAAGLGSAAERGMLLRLLLAAEASEEGRLREMLVSYACELEAGRRLPEADAVMTLALATAPGNAEVALHAGRVARMQGDRERALGLYRTARELDVSGSIGRLAAIGEAVVSADPERALTAVLRAARLAGDPEAAGVALEERARARREAGRRSAAVRDLCVAAARFPDPVDRARVAHEVADLCIAAADPSGAREALLVALEVGDASQRQHATSRLHTVSRDLSDRLGMRRWRSFDRPKLVSLSSRPGAPSGASLGPMLARWRARAASAMN